MRRDSHKGSQESARDTSRSRKRDASRRTSPPALSTLLFLAFVSALDRVHAADFNCQFESDGRSFDLTPVSVQQLCGPFSTACCDAAAAGQPGRKASRPDGVIVCRSGHPLAGRRAMPFLICVEKTATNSYLSYV